MRSAGFEDAFPFISPELLSAGMVASNPNMVGSVSCRPADQHAYPSTPDAPRPAKGKPPFREGGSGKAPYKAGGPGKGAPYKGGPGKAYASRGDGPRSGPGGGFKGKPSGGGFKGKPPRGR